MENFSKKKNKMKTFSKQKIIKTGNGNFQNRKLKNF